MEEEEAATESARLERLRSSHEDRDIRLLSAISAKRNRTARDDKRDYGQLIVLKT